MVRVGNKSVKITIRGAFLGRIKLFIHVLNDVALIFQCPTIFSDNGIQIFNIVLRGYIFVEYRGKNHPVHG